MAMTKAEKAEVHALRVALALRMPDYPEPQPMTFEEIKASRTVEVPSRYRPNDTLLVAKGWDWNSHSKQVTEVYSDGMYHSRGGHGSWSQAYGRLYRTKRDALQAMRIALSKQYAEDLAAIDEVIALTPPTNNPSAEN